MKAFYLYILLIATTFFSCHNKQKEKEKQILQLVNEWQGKQIVFPENVVFTRYLTDTTDFQIPQSEYKVLIYVDSIGCTNCKLKLDKWKELIEYTDSVIQNKVPFLFFIHPKMRGKYVTCWNVMVSTIPFVLIWTTGWTTWTSSRLI